jgi:hypothetical protein
MKGNNKWLLVFYLALFTFSLINAQCTIMGSLYDSTKKPIAQAQAILYDSSGKKILGFASSDEKGLFEISAKTNDTFLLKINHISYTNYSTKLTCHQFVQNITLEENSYKLQEIIIKNKRVERKGDTLVYDALSLRTVQDQNLEDIIRKIPNIEISKGGAISYKGLAISKFMINYLDLLEGRYALATKNLNPDIISKVEILENHQSVKLLKNISIPEEAAINIKLKSNVAITGKIKAGAGITPLLYNTDNDLFAFFKKRQGHLKLSTNNIGFSNRSQLINQYQATDLSNFDFNLLSTTQVNLPLIDKEQYNFNKERLVSLSLLQKLGSNLELKLQGSIVADARKLSSLATTSYTAGGNLVIFDQKISNRLNLFDFDIKSIIEYNSNRFYTKGEIRFISTMDNDFGNLNVNRLDINESLMGMKKDLESDFNHMIKVKNKAYRFRSSFNWSNLKQDMLIRSSNFIANGQIYNFPLSWQSLNKSRFVAHVFGGRSERVGQVSLDFFGGSKFSREDFVSKLRDSDLVLTLFENDLQRNESKLYLNSFAKYRKDQWTLSFDMPLSMLNASIANRDGRSLSSINGVFGMPKLGANYRINRDFSVGSSFTYGSVMSSDNRFHENFILQRYQTLTVGNPILFRETSRSTNLGIYRSDNEKMNSQNLSLTFSHTLRPFLSNLEINNSGIASSYVKSDQIIDRVILSNRNSFRLFDLMKVDLGFSFSQSIIDQLVNSKMLKNKFNTLNFNGGLGYVNTRFGFKENFNFQYTQIDGSSNPYQITNDLEFSLILSKLINLNIFHNYLITATNDNKNIYNMINTEVTFKKKNSKTTYRLVINNLANTKYLTTIYQDQIYQEITSVALRPRQLLFTIQKNF